MWFYYKKKDFQQGGSSNWWNGRTYSETKNFRGCMKVVGWLIRPVYTKRKNAAGVCTDYIGINNLQHIVSFVLQE